MTCKYTGGYIYQVVSGGIPLRCELFQKKKNRPEKYPFKATDNLIVLAVRWSVKYFSAPNSPLFRKSRGGEENGVSRQMQRKLSSEFCKIFKNTFLQNTSGRLFLFYQYHTKQNLQPKKILILSMLKLYNNKTYLMLFRFCHVAMKYSERPKVLQLFRSCKDKKQFKLKNTEKTLLEKNAWIEK